ncbi:hypothetical protein E3N88_19739 [Mikania micrantha]|uniref:Fe2OG dioxygenase domain-containing protein n=1 Tax=Mikania micrantha TaxID=192012 RepID=A0A5N6NR08_9ASTR|nr:hypothetical protein E3N88_19739 [Mikania micrantha]
MPVARENDPSLPSTSTASADVTNGNGMARIPPANADSRLGLNPNRDHRAENYDDLAIEFNPLLFSSLERYLPRNLLNAPREIKYEYMRGTLRPYLIADDRNRVQKHNEYRQKIISSYPHMYRELHALNPSMFFVESFLRAFSAPEKIIDECIRDIINEVAPGVYTFDMLQPGFCEMLIREVENFENWARKTRFMIMRPLTLNKFGVVLDDFGMKGTLDNLLEDFISRISKVAFPDVYALDSHHGFTIEYGMDRDVGVGLHVDESEVTLNVCLGKQFTGGELVFRGVRCEKHLNSEARLEETFEFSHILGHAFIHRGGHRHGVAATTSGHRINLVMWCRSSALRELKKHTKDCSNICEYCKRETEERLLQSVAARKKALLVREGDAAS